MNTTWKHEDSDPKASLALALETRSYVARPDGSALTTTDRVHLVRSLAIATQYVVLNARVVGVLAGEKDAVRTLGDQVRGDMFASPDHCYAASTLARTWMLFADPGRYTLSSATTRDGEPAAHPVKFDAVVNSDAAFPPLLLAAVLVVAIAAFSAAICYVGQAAAEVVDRKLTQDTLTTRMLSTQARSVAMVDDHSERERAAGHPLPWSPQELQLLDTLLGTQKEIAARTNSPLPNPFAGAVEKVGEAAKAAAGSVADVGLGLGTIAALAAGAYALTR